MEKQTTSIPIFQIAEKKAGTTYTFREITEAVELEQAFRLRYEVYSKSRLNPWLKKNIFQIDIDIFDLHSAHFGIFTSENDLIGYLRVVHDKTNFYNKTVFEIGTKYFFFDENHHSWNSIINSQDADFPCLSYPNIPDQVLLHYHILRTKCKGFTEASRLIIKEEYRGFKMSSFLIDCALVLFILICNGEKYALMSCCKEHCSFYEKYGFHPLGNGLSYSTFEESHLSAAMYLPAISCQLLSKFNDQRTQFIFTGKITKTL